MRSIHFFFVTVPLICILQVDYTFSDLSTFFSNLVGSEHCGEPWIKHDYERLEKQFEANLFGQHIASQTLFNLLKRYLDRWNYPKALVLSVHGPTGTGKTFSWKLIIETFYKLGASSSFVHFFKVHELYSLDRDFDIQANRLNNTVRSIINSCQYPILIFEDAHLMNPKLLDVIYPMIEHLPRVDRIYYNRAIFIFICNTGADMISDFILTELSQGRERESITLHEMHKFLHGDVMKNESPYRGTTFVSRNLVDAYIPFLPLERKHVKECVHAIMRNISAKFDEEFVDNIVNSVPYFPESNPLFSVSGCKRLEYIIADQMP